MVVCAGKGSSVDSSIVERFNVSLTSWQPQLRLNGALPPVGYNRMTVASDGENAYIFSGSSGSGQLCNKIYQVNLWNFQCCELIPATPVCPTPRENSTIIYLNRTLVSYGGYTGGGTISNELFVFDLNTSETVTITMQSQCGSLEIHPSCHHLPTSHVPLVVYQFPEGSLPLLAPT